MRARRRATTPREASYVTLDADLLITLVAKHFGMRDPAIWKCGCGCEARGRPQLLALGRDGKGEVLIVSNTADGLPDNFSLRAEPVACGSEVADAVGVLAAHGLFNSGRAGDAIAFARRVLGQDFWGRWPEPAS